MYKYTFKLSLLLSLAVLIPSIQFNPLNSSNSVHPSFVVVIVFTPSMQIMN